MSGNGSDRTHLTVGSLRGVPLGSSMSRTGLETVTGAAPVGRWSPRRVHGPLPPGTRDQAAPMHA